MLLGPLNPLLLNRLKELLESKNIPFTVTYDDDEADQARAVQRMRNNSIATAHPTFKGLKDFLYIDLEVEHASQIQSELEQLGLSIRADQEEPVPEIPEFFCPEPGCHYEASEPTLCPRHKRRLLEFSEWHATRTVLKTSSAGRLQKIAILVVLLIVAYQIYRIY